MNPEQPELLPATPEQAEARRIATERARYVAYRKATRPYRRAFRGIISRKEAERLFLASAKARARKEMTGD